MKRQFLVFLFLVSYFLIYCDFCMAANQERVTGRVFTVKNESGNVEYYVKTKGSQIVRLGTYDDITDTEGQDCVVDAYKVPYNPKITLEGDLTYIEQYHGYKTYAFKGIYQCLSPIAPEQHILHSDNAYGPKIFGLQLGMSKAEAEDILARLARKRNLIFDERGELTDFLLFDQDTMQYVVVDINESSSNTPVREGEVYSYILNPPLFNIRGNFDREFLQKFIDTYHIPQLVPDGNVLTYRDAKQGFQVRVHPNAIAISAIPKSTEPIFE